MFWETIYAYILIDFVDGKKWSGPEEKPTRNITKDNGGAYKDSTIEVYYTSYYYSSHEKV